MLFCVVVKKKLKLRQYFRGKTGTRHRKWYFMMLKWLTNEDSMITVTHIDLKVEP